MTILVVDDSPIDRRLASRLLEKEGFITVTAANGREALAALEQERVSIVVTDLVMPEMDGLSLVGAILARDPTIRVILMTAYGSDEIAIRALLRGAVSYVPKRQLATSLAETVRSVLSLLPVPDAPPESVRTLERAEWELGNDLEEIPRVVSLVEKRLERSSALDQGSRIHMSIALREAIVNAILHGNLEISSSLKESDPDAHDALARERQTQAPYRERRVRVSLMESPDEVTCVVSDDGSGFDLSVVSDPTEAVNLERTSGRGLFLIRTFMTSVRHSDGGRTISMVKRRSG
jgi:CheY-like chemotaxis protein/anti-sigma regulatory factor (Ser/Thr protein kinase)